MFRSRTGIRLKRTVEINGLLSKSFILHRNLEPSYSSQVRRIITNAAKNVTLEHSGEMRQSGYLPLLSSASFAVHFSQSNSETICRPCSDEQQILSKSQPTKPCGKGVLYLQQVGESFTSLPLQMLGWGGGGGGRVHIPHLSCEINQLSPMCTIPKPIDKMTNTFHV